MENDEIGEERNKDVLPSSQPWSSVLRTSPTVPQVFNLFQFRVGGSDFTYKRTGRVLYSSSTSVNTVYPERKLLCLSIRKQHLMKWQPVTCFRQTSEGIYQSLRVFHVNAESLVDFHSRAQSLIFTER